MPTTHQLAADLEDAVDAPLWLSTFGLIPGEAGAQVEQQEHEGQGELGGQDGEKVFLELGMPTQGFSSQLLQVDNPVLWYNGWFGRVVWSMKTAVMSEAQDLLQEKSLDQYWVWDWMTADSL